ncbi:MAG: AAA family ATPase [Xenococcaceae cyanobacterium MO_234.B1]|nr:AAA family ATPase [Xenococcaceae cyanobacterium MO_234.B1]
MRLISLQLCNFRQFYGITIPIKFASGKANSTVIHGNNGAGKTAILNAFTWVLYEQFTAAFAAPELLINQRAIQEANLGVAVECWVELQFERDRKRYQLKRKCYATRNQDNTIEYSKAKLFILVSADDGKWYPPLEASEDIIEQILPLSLHQYFFFDGERIDNFFRNNKNNTIAEDTKELLGVKVLDRAIEHLKKAERSLREELQAIGDPQTKKLLAQQQEIELSIERSQNQIIAILNQVKTLEAEKKYLVSQLQDLSGSAQLQQLKTKLTQQESSLRKNLVTIRSELKQLLSRHSYLVFLSSITSQTLETINTSRQQNLLSAGVKKEFIQHLLNQNQCLCGNPLLPETTTYQKVAALLSQLESNSVEVATIHLEADINNSDTRLSEFWQELDRKQAEINRQHLELHKIEQELEKINSKLRSYPDRNIQQLQAQLDTIDEKLKELILEQGITQQQLSTYQQATNKLSQQIDKQQLQEAKQIVTQKRIRATQESIKIIIEVKNRLEHQFRESLVTKVREIFDSISFTPYIPQLSQNYELTLIEKTSGQPVPVAASTGENQILSLSFIGAIIDRVREWSQRNTLMGPDSSTFPIVMDSPFGSLDEIYRRQVAKAIPQLANQLVILVTKTQWRQEVETEIGSLVGQEYVLVYHSPKPDCQKDWLRLYGNDYPLVCQSENQFEYTEVVAVKQIEKQRSSI